MQGFITRDKHMPDKRAPDARRADFGEIYAEYDARNGAAQADRCAQCGVPFCQAHCPLQNNIPDWLRLVAQGRMEEAYAVSSSTNTFPEICGRICPQDRLCEGSCVIEQSGHGTVTIGAIEKYITETAFDNGWVKPRLPECERPESAGIIGAGPGGLAAAEMLRAYGYQVTVYDRYDRVGGLMVYGIPNFKLDKSVVARREAQLRAQGVNFELNTNIDDLNALREKHDAVLITTGVYKARDLTIKGYDLPGVAPALQYLVTSNRSNLGDAVPDYDSGLLNARGRNVAVIGGGDTAMDCVRTAIRQGAKSVKCLYRRDRKNMPGSAREVAHAEEEGVEFLWLTSPVEIKDGAQGGVTAITARRMELGAPDKTGRRRPQEITASDFDVEADLVIKALGFEPEELPVLFGAPDLRTTPWGTIIADYHTKMTSIDGVFAAGDIVRGASLVVWAIKDGRDAAEAMHFYMRDKAAAMVEAAE